MVRSETPTLKTDLFQEALVHQHQLTLVIFRAEWSGGTHLMDPSIEYLMEQYQDRVDFLVLDEDLHQDLVASYCVRLFPTMLFFVHGMEVRRIEGIGSRALITDVIEDILTLENFHKL